MLSTTSTRAPTPRARRSTAGACKTASGKGRSGNETNSTRAAWREAKDTMRWASGTPVVASRLGGLAELVQHGVTRFLIEPGNVAELRERLAQALRNPSLAARLGRNTRELVLERFTGDACAERCLGAYAELFPPARRRARRGQHPGRTANRP